MTVLLPFRRYLLGAAWCRNLLWKRARAVPSLDLDFAGKKSLKDGISNQDLITFTRASSGTFVDSDGVLRTAVTNLLLQSEDFSTTWSLTGLLSFGAGSTVNVTTAPNNTDTADLITENTSTGNHFIQQSVTVATGTVYTVSVYAKLPVGSTRQVTLFVANTNFTVSPNATFNLSSGTVVNTFNGTASIVSLPNNWYRLVLTTVAATSSGSNAVSIRLNNGTSTSYTGDGTSGLFLWGAQIEQSATVGEYIPTTSVINSAPRFDHNPTTGESLGLLVEEARTNSIRNNTMVGAVVGTPGTTPTNWAVGGSGIGTLTQQVVAIGSLGSLSYIDVRYSGTTSTTGFIFAFEPSTSVAALTGQSWTQSVYFALIAGSISNINSLRHDVVERTLVGGSVLQNFSSDFKSTLTANLTRSTYSVALSGGATTAYAQPSIEFSFASGVAIDITLRIGLPQLEQGTFATSVIPTTTATVTRAADVASITGSNFSSWYNQTEGTVFAECSALLNTSQGICIFRDSASATTNTRLRKNSGNLYSGVLRDAGGTKDITVTPSPALTAGQNIKMALAFKTNNCAFTGGGQNPGTQNTFTLASMNTFDINGSIGVGESAANTTIKRLTYWPTRLSNTTIQQITQP